LIGSFGEPAQAAGAQLSAQNNASVRIPDERFDALAEPTKAKLSKA
jgi:hypothetical protein